MSSKKKERVDEYELQDLHAVTDPAPVLFPRPSPQLAKAVAKDTVRMQGIVDARAALSDDTQHGAVSRRPPPFPRSGSLAEQRGRLKPVPALKPKVVAFEADAHTGLMEQMKKRIVAELDEEAVSDDSAEWRVS